MTAGLREQRRQEKDRVGREQILGAAERVFGQKGFHQATLREVAEEAEFSVGALYGFFEGKDDLFVQVLEREGEALLDEQRAAVAGIESPLVQLHRIADTQLAYFRARPDFYRLFQREMGGSTWSRRASLNERGYERYRAVMEFESGIVAAGVAAGEMRAADPVVLAALFSGIMQAYIAQWVAGLESDGGSDLEARFAVGELHELIDRTFAARSG